MPTEKVGNVIFNETRSLSSSPEADINEVREDIAHTIRNGEDWGNTYGIPRPITAGDAINGNIPQAEMQTYSNSQTAAANADASIKQGIDPTHGAIYFYMAGDDQTVKYGKLTLSTGPFYNSFPNRSVPYKEVYINFSK